MLTLSKIAANIIDVGEIAKHVGYMDVHSSELCKL